MEYEVKPPLEEKITYQSDNFKVKKTKKTALIILTLIMLGTTSGIFGSLYAKIWNPLWNPFRPEPKVVLSEMALKMKELKTFHVEGDFEAEGDYEANISTNVVLDVDRTSAKNPKIKGAIKVPTFLTEIEFIQIDKDFYLEPGILSNYLEEYLSYVVGEELIGETGGFKNKWIKINQQSIENVAEVFSEYTGEEINIGEELSQEKQKELAQEIVKLFIGKKFYEVEKELPDEKIGNQLFYHYLITLNQDEIKKLTLDMITTALKYSPESYRTNEEFVSGINEELPKAIDDFFEKIGEIDFEVWIGQKDNYLYRFKLEKEDFEEEAIKSIFVDINFSEFNQPREINPPAEFIDMEKILGSVVEKIAQQRKEQEEHISDARRESDMRQISLAMEMYYDDEMKYLQSSVLPNTIGTYLSPLPKDPGNGPCSSYKWISNTGDSQQYCVWACLKDGKFLAASEKGTITLNKAPTSLYCW